MLVVIPLISSPHHDGSVSPPVTVYRTLRDSTASDTSSSCPDQHLPCDDSNSPVAFRHASRDSSIDSNNSSPQLAPHDDSNSPLVGGYRSPYDSTASSSSCPDQQLPCDDSNSPVVVVRRSPRDSTASGNSSCPDQHLPCHDSNSPVAIRRTSRIDSTSSKTSHPSSAFKVASKVFNYFMKPEGKLQHSKLYKKGDRVVVYSMKDQRPITATVHWTGAVQMSTQSEVPSVIFAGLEPVRCKLCVL